MKAGEVVSGIRLACLARILHSLLHSEFAPNGAALHLRKPVSLELSPMLYKD